MPHRDRRIHVPRAGDLLESLNIRDFGDEVHLWFEQRVSWRVALEILKELTHDAACHPRGPRRAAEAPICLPRVRDVREHASVAVSRSS